MGHVFYHGHVIKTHKLHTERHNLPDSFTHLLLKRHLQRVQPKATHSVTSITLLDHLSYSYQPWTSHLEAEKHESSSHMYTYAKIGDYIEQTHHVWTIFTSDNPWLSSQKRTICTNLLAIINADNDHTSIFCTLPSKLPQLMPHNPLLTLFNTLITSTTFSWNTSTKNPTIITKPNNNPFHLNYFASLLI
jgi:hypothetical protein